MNHEDTFDPENVYNDELMYEELKPGMEDLHFRLDWHAYREWQNNGEPAPSMLSGPKRSSRSSIRNPLPKRSDKDTGAQGTLF